MPRFFIAHTPRIGETVTLPPEEARHIAGALRMRAGEELTLCDGQGTDFTATLLVAEKESVSLVIREATPCITEPSLKVTLYMGLPKADKMEWIIQKTVELGVTAIVPVITSRTIVRLDEKDGMKKAQRWQKIANEAAGQSGRGILPAVEPPLRWKEALKRWETENTLLCYEGGGQPIGTLVSPDTGALSLVVGPEGGFSPEEVQTVTALGGRIATLGKRILRCETAPIAALAVAMERSGNMQ